jgi:hypothetical protein
MDADGRITITVPGAGPGEQATDLDKWLAGHARSS